MESHSPRMTHVLNPSDTILLKNTPCFGLREDSVSGLLTARPRVGIVALLPSFPFLYHWRQAVAWGYCKGRRGATGPITAEVQKSDFGPSFTLLQSCGDWFDRRRDFGKMSQVNTLWEVKVLQLNLHSIASIFLFVFLQSRSKVGRKSRLVIPVTEILQILFHWRYMIKYLKVGLAGTIVDVLCIISKPYKGFCLSFHKRWKKRSLGLNNTGCTDDFVKTKQAAGKSKQELVGKCWQKWNYSCFKGRIYRSK